MSFYKPCPYGRLIESTNCQLWVVEDQNVTPWQEGFADYRYVIVSRQYINFICGYTDPDRIFREHLLRKLEEQLAAIMPGSGERPTAT